MPLASLLPLSQHCLYLKWPPPASTAAAKVAFLTQLLQNEEEVKIVRFTNPLEIKDWSIDKTQYNKLNKLKKNNPEAFYYWYKAL